MLRYITAATIAALLLAVALKSRQGDASESDEASPSNDTTIIHAKPNLSVTPAEDGGLDLKLSHRFAGAVSRASLVYDLDGTQCTLDKTSNCQRSLEGKVKGDSYQSEVELAGHLPEGYTALRLVLEDETGTRVLPVTLD